jgi:hypothetical protein
METSTSIKEISAAMLNFTKAMGKIPKASNNPFFKSKYAALPDILDAINKPLEDNGLLITQHPEGDDELTTLVIHPFSGEFMRSTVKMHPVKNDPQSLGSAITYQRRYALGAILGLNIDEDDDGNAASGKTTINHTDIKPDTNSITATKPEKPWLNVGSEKFTEAQKFVANGGSLETIRTKYRVSKETETQLMEVL